MIKRIVMGTLVVFITWSLVDMVVHGFILGPSYEATSQLWRDQSEMNMGVMWGAGLISAFFFTLLYTLFITPKNVANGGIYGLLFGLCSGISMGFGSWTVMPIPLSMAIVWFIGSVAEAAIGGIILGLIIKESL